MIQRILFFFFLFYWSVADLQYCANLCCTAKWLIYTHTFSLMCSFPGAAFQEAGPSLRPLTVQKRGVFQALPRWSPAGSPVSSCVSGLRGWWSWGAGLLPPTPRGALSCLPWVPIPRETGILSRGSESLRGGPLELRAERQHTPHRGASWDRAGVCIYRAVSISLKGSILALKSIISILGRSERWSRSVVSDSLRPLGL